MAAAQVDATLVDRTEGWDPAAPPAAAAAAVAIGNYDGSLLDILPAGNGFRLQRTWYGIAAAAMLVMVAAITPATPPMELSGAAGAIPALTNHLSATMANPTPVVDSLYNMFGRGCRS